jgi:hypothetical protein
MSNVNPEPTPVPKSIFLVAHPKIVFLYPTFVMAIIAGLYYAFSKHPEGETSHFISRLFLFVLAINLIVIAFDFPRTTSLTIFFAAVAIVVGALLAFDYYPDLWPKLHDLIISLKPTANATFYFLFAAILAGIYVAVLIQVRFDYWEVRQNELLHHHGIWGNLERFAAPNLRIDKEIDDIFEYLLLRSGRLVLHPSDERRAIVLDNVFFINQKEAELIRMLGSLEVQVQPDNK